MTLYKQSITVRRYEEKFCSKLLDLSSSVAYLASLNHQVRGRKSKDSSKSVNPKLGIFRIGENSKMGLFCRNQFLTLSPERSDVQVYSEASSASLLQQVCNTSTLWTSWLSRGSLSSNHKRGEFLFYLFETFFCRVCLDFTPLPGKQWFYFRKGLKKY